MKVSIVVVSHNSLNLLKDCLDHIEKHTNCPYELIIVDNTSRDGTQKWLKSWRKLKHSQNVQQLKIIYNEKNRFWPGAVNQGIKHSKGKYIALVNSDVVVTVNWLPNLLKLFKELPLAAGIAPLMGGIPNYSYNDQDYRTHFGELPVKYPPDKELQEFSAGFHQKYAGSYLETKILCSACMVIKREVLPEVGGWDENFKLRGDDWEWCLRARSFGYRIYAAVDTLVVHYGVGSIKTMKSETRKKLMDRDFNYWVNVLYKYQNPATMPEKLLTMDQIRYQKVPFLDVSHLCPEIIQLMTWDDVFINKYPFLFSGESKIIANPN